MPGEDGCFGTPFGGLFEAVDMRSLQNRNLALKRKTKTQTKIVAPGGANDHPAIGTSRKEKDFSKGPRNPGELSQHAHAVGPHLQTLGIRVTTSSVNLSFGSHNTFSLTSYEANIHAGHHPSVSQTP